MQNRIQVKSYNRVQYKNRPNRMRSLIFFACILACVYFSSATDIRPQLRQAVSPSAEDIEACFDEADATRTTILNEEDIINEIYLQPEMEGRKNKTGCFLACVLRKLEMLDESGLKEQKIHSELSKVVNKIDESFAPKVHKIAHKCIRQAKNFTLPCEIGFELMKCASKELHEACGHGEHTTEHEDHEEHEEHA